MKKLLLFSLSAISLLLPACGTGFDYAVQPGGIRVEDSSGNLAGYWINDVSGPLMYVPDLDLYVAIHLETGAYRFPSEEAFFSDGSCSSPITFGHQTNTVLAMPNGKFFKVISVSTTQGSFTVGSSIPLGSTTCGASAGPITTPDAHATRDGLEEIASPRDFTALAPLKLVLPR